MKAREIENTDFDELLADYVDGALSDADAARVKARAAVDPSFAALLADAEAARRVLSGLPRTEPPPRLAQRVLADRRLRRRHGRFTPLIVSPMPAVVMAFVALLSAIIAYSILGPNVEREEIARLSDEPRGNLPRELADRDVARPMFARDARSGEADESAFKSSVGADDAIVGAKGGEKNEMPAPKPEAKLEYRGAIGRFAKVPAEKSGTRAEFATGGETGGSSGAGKGIDTLGGVAAPTASVEAPEQSVEGKAQTADVPAQEMKDEESARSVAARKADAPTTAQPPPAPAKSAPAGPPAAASDNGWRQDGAVREKERDEAGVASPSGEAEQSPATRGEIGRRFDGRNSGLTRGDMRVVRQDAAFDELWTRLWATRAQPPPRPAIDFARQVVVTVALGTQPTGGHGVRIESVRLAGSVLTVVVLETHPRPGAVVTQSMTQPFSVVVVEFDGRIPEDLEVRFDRRVTEGDLP